MPIVLLIVSHRGKKQNFSIQQACSFFDHKQCIEVNGALPIYRLTRRHDSEFMHALINQLRQKLGASSTFAYRWIDLPGLIVKSAPKDAFSQCFISSCQFNEAAR